MQSDAIRGNRRQSDAIRRNQRHSVGERWTKSIVSGTHQHSIVISGTPPSVAAAVTSSSSPSQGQSGAISGSSRYIELEPICSNPSTGSAKAYSAVA